jgi:hypothetical protein
VGQDTVAVLRDLLGYDEARLAQLAESGAFGELRRKPSPSELQA